MPAARSVFWAAVRVSLTVDILRVVGDITHGDRHGASAGRERGEHGDVGDDSEHAGLGAHGDCTSGGEGRGDEVLWRGENGLQSMFFHVAFKPAWRAALIVG